MKQVLVLSGKGGTGKTSLTACFASLSHNAVLLDTDVDAANLHLLLKPENLRREDFYCGSIAELDASQCKGCGKCVELCQFNAVSFCGSEGSDGVVLDQLLCEGCGVCADHCVTKAITMVPRHSGYQFLSDTKFGPLLYASLEPSGENSGKLVASLRQQGQKLAQEEEREMVLIDGPPGIGCTVIAAASGCDLAVLVTEPTPAGLHDLQRAVKLMEHFAIPVAIITNKASLNQDVAEAIRCFAEREGLSFLGELPYDAVFTQAQRKGETVLTHCPESEVAENIKSLWKKIEKIVES